MSKRSQDKRRARSKEKQLAKRRQLGTSPLSRLAPDDACECWATYATDDGIRSYAILRTVKGGGYVYAFFLIDFDCLGVKDAFVRLDVELADIRESLRTRSELTGARYVKISLDEARATLASALAWMERHPFFRVPPHTVRCIKVLGGIPPLDSADTSEFGTEDGDLFYIGRQSELERALVGISLDDFLDRDDVEYEFTDELYDQFDHEASIDTEEPEDSEEAQKFAEELQETMRRKLLEAVRRWCFAHHQAPHPELERAIDLMLAASLEGMLTEGPDIDFDPTPSELETAAAIDAENTLMSLESPEDQALLAAARRQLHNYMESFPSPADMYASLSLPAPENPDTPNSP